MLKLELTKELKKAYLLDTMTVRNLIIFLTSKGFKSDKKDINKISLSDLKYKDKPLISAMIGGHYIEINFKK